LGAFLRAFGGWSFLARFRRSTLFAGLACRCGAFFALFLFFDHLDFARSCGGSSGCFRSLFFLCAWRPNRDEWSILVTDQFDARRRLDFTDVNGLADVQIADIDGDLLG